MQYAFDNNCGKEEEKKAGDVRPKGKCGVTDYKLHFKIKMVIIFPYVHSFSQFTKFFHFHFLLLLLKHPVSWAGQALSPVSYTTLQFCFYFFLYIYGAQIPGFKSLLCHLLAV